MQNNKTTLILAASSAVALLTAYVSQYGFDLQPCILCIYQRIPYFVILLLALLIFTFRNNQRVFSTLSYLSLITLIIGLGIAAYHVGVEQKIFESSGCVDNQPEPQTIEEMRQQLLNTEYVACDKPQFVFLGLSMAAWNVLYSLLIIAIIGKLLWFQNQKAQKK